MPLKDGSDYTAQEKRDMVQTHRFLYYELNAAVGADDHYIDLARDLSRFNRRLYRQGMLYHIANITIHDSQGNANVKFGIAPNTWPTHAAWTLAFTHWKKQRAMLLEDSQTSSPKWSDFKVYINKEHVRDSDWGRPKDDDGNGIDNAEWDYADISFNREGSRYDNYAIGLLGEHSDSTISDESSADDTSYDGYISMIEMLQEVRKYPIDGQKDVDRDDSIAFGMNLYDPAAVEDIIDQIYDEGDLPPYPLDFVGSNSNPDDDTGVFVVRHANVASTYSPIAQVGGFPVPCGLMQIKTVNGHSSENTIGVLIELAPGPYLGVAATPMGDYKL